MYHCTLHIVIVNGDPLLENMVRSVNAMERFDYLVAQCTAGRETVPEKGDVVFLGAGAGSPLKWRAVYQQAALILCADTAAVRAMTDDEIKAVDDIWEEPLNKRLAEKRFRNILTALKLRKDFLLTMACLDTAIDSIPDMIWFKDRDGLHQKVNSGFCKIVGKPKEDVTGKDHCYIWDISREEFERGEFVCKDTDDYVLRTKNPCQSDEKVKCEHGMRQFKTYKSPLLDEDGSVIGTVGIAHDVTDLENMGAEIEILLSSMPYAIVVCNDLGDIINVNSKFEQYFKVRQKDILGSPYREWMNNAFEKENKVNSEGYIESRVAASGLTLEIHEEHIYDVFKNIVGGLSIYRDVTVERALEEKIIRSSNTDFMTGLYNRRCFYQYMNNNRGERPVSLLYVDLDHFKQVNDTYGHRTGDAALVQTAKLLQESFSREFIARFGGDEFLIALLGPVALSELVSRAESLLARIQDAFAQSEQLRILTASVGIAQTEDPSLDIDILIQQSDSALYEAKQSGRACCRVYRQDTGGSMEKKHQHSAML